MITIDTRSSDRRGPNASGLNCTRRPASSAPASAAVADASPKATSFMKAGEIVREEARCSFSRTAMIERPTPVPRR